MVVDEDDPFEQDDADPLPVRKETGPVLFLSLFLLLLAFFILLNSISTLQETKSRDVLSSVAATFQADTVPDRTAEILVSTLGPVPEPEEVVDEVERLWLTEVPFVKVERITNGRDILIELPTTQVFVGAAPDLRGDRRDLIAATAHALSARLPNVEVTMQAILFVEDLTVLPVVPGDLPVVEDTGVIDTADLDSVFEATGGLDASELASIRAGILTRAFIAGGTPPGNMAIGVRKGDDSRVRIRFFIREADGVRLTFSDGAGG